MFIPDPATTTPRAYLTQVTSRSDAQTTPTVQYSYYSGGLLNGLLNTITEPDNGTHSYTYFPNGKAFEVTDPLGNETHVSFNLYRSRTSFVDERGNLSSYDYDNNGLLLKLTYPDGATESYTWQNSLMQSSTDAMGNTESYQFDPLGNLIATVDKKGVATTMTYDTAFSQMTGITRNGRVTTFTLDSTKRNTTRITDALGDVTTMAYYANGLLQSRMAPKGNVVSPDGNYTTTYTYNDAGLVLTTTTGLPSTVASTYDPRGDVLSVTDATGIRSDFTYDLLGRKLTQKLPNPGGPGSSVRWWRPGRTP
jgi:YD repeat-containing protein